MATKRTETAMASAMAKAGLNTAEYRLRMLALDALKKHHNNVQRAISTFERSIVVIVEGDQDLFRELMLFYLKHHSLPVADHPRIDAQPADVSDRQDNGGAGQGSRVSHITAARPVVEPSAQQRAADLDVAKRISVLDTFKIAGQSIGDWNIAASKAEGLQMSFHGRVLIEARKEVEGRIANIENWMRFRDVLTEDMMHRVIQRAAEMSDGA